MQAAALVLLWVGVCLVRVEARGVKSRAPEVEPGKAGGRDLSREEVDRLLSAPSPLWGFQKKAGMLDPEEWLPEASPTRHRNGRAWLEAIRNGTVDPMAQPPRATMGCQVFVNHHYKFFWIKTRKTGGTSLNSGLGWLCDITFKDSGNPDKQYCSRAPWKDPTPVEGDPESWWEDYFVFSTVRNPYARFASAHAFSQRWSCQEQSLGEGCKDPFFFGNRCAPDDEECCRAPIAYIKHVQEHTSCLFTKDGELAVDFIARTENLSEDFPVIVKEINKRRNPGVPPLSEKPPIEKNVNDDGTNGYTDLFMQYPECFGDLDKVLENEFRDLQYIKE